MGRQSFPILINQHKFVASTALHKLLLFHISGITAHDDNNVDMSDSEEEEYNNGGMVYDSENSEDDFDSGDEEIVSQCLLLFWVAKYSILLDQSDGRHLRHSNFNWER